MARAKRGFKAKNRRNKVLKLAKGFKSRRKNCRKLAMQSVAHALKYSYRDRRQKKRMFRSLWIVRISAALRLYNLSYSRFMKALKDKNIELNRKIISNMAIQDPKAFEAIVKMVQPQVNQ